MPKVFTGIVSSTAADKTITVSVHRIKNHPVYKKQFAVSKKFLVHDEKNQCEVGDKVTIIETKPFSSKKSFKLDKVVEKAELTGKDKEAISGETSEEKAMQSSESTQ